MDRRNNHNNANQSIVLITLIGLLVFSLQPTLSSVYAGETGRLASLLEDAKDLNESERYEESLNLLFSSNADGEEESELKEMQEKTFVLYVYNEIVLGFKQVSENKNDVAGYERAARGLRFAGQDHRAMELLLDGVTENPKAASLWVSIGGIEMKYGRDVEALSVFREALKLDDGNAAAHNNTAYIRATSENGQIHDLLIAQKHAKIALKLEPENPDYIDTMAEIEYQKGNLDTATKLIKKAIALAPYDSFLKMQLTRFQNVDSIPTEAPEMSFDQEE